jgi:methylmalonyl-CoA/ethylmalonyl-CoA epimerase
MHHFTKIDHIGIAVNDLEASTKNYQQILGRPPYKQEEVHSEHVTTVFFETGESKIELLGATHPDSAIAKYLDKKGEGIHHIAFAVDDIITEMSRLRSLGYKLINEAPKRGADNKLICFMHPKDTNGVLIELCQDIKD